MSFRSASFSLKKGDRAPSIASTLLVDDAAVDLTGATVTFVMRLEGSAIAKVNAAATIVSASEGKVRYDWGASDTDTVGMYQAEWSVTFPGAIKRTFPSPGYLWVEVQESLA